MTPTKRAYALPLLLLFALVAGGLTGYVLGNQAAFLKPFGDIFLNLIFTAIVPLVFFSIATTITTLGNTKKLGNMLLTTLLVFLFTSLIAALYMVSVVYFFPPAEHVMLPLPAPHKMEPIRLSTQLVGLLTVPDFTQLLTHRNMLPLIFFACLVGLATSLAGEKGKSFVTFLQAGATIFTEVTTLIMYYAPIGFFAYFAFLVGELGPQLVENYLRVTVIYYSAGCLYFIFVLTGFAYLAGKIKSVKLFWQHILLSSCTALATCSSAASIPANLTVASKMKISPLVYETVIPLGAVLHKDGSVLGGILKIAFLFGVFHLDFSGIAVIVTAIGVGMLVGTVMGAIPSGGMLGEIMILSLYGFPPEALLYIAAISLIIDPLATMLNVTTNTVCTMLVARFYTDRT